MLTEQEQAELEASKKRHPSRNNGKLPITICGLCWEIPGLIAEAVIYSEKYGKPLCAECYEENH